MKSRLGLVRNTGDSDAIAAVLTRKIQVQGGLFTAHSSSWLGFCGLSSFPTLPVFIKLWTWGVCSTKSELQLIVLVCIHLVLLDSANCFRNPLNLPCTSSTLVFPFLSTFGWSRDSMDHEDWLGWQGRLLLTYLGTGRDLLIFEIFLLFDMRLRFSISLFYLTAMWRCLLLHNSFIQSICWVASCNNEYRFWYSINFPRTLPLLFLLLLDHRHLYRRKSSVRIFFSVFA